MTIQRNASGVITAWDKAHAASHGAGGSDALSTIPITQGGTGRTSHTAYAVLCGGDAATSAQQSIASVGTTGQVLTSNGAGALPTMQTIPATAGRIVQVVNVQTGASATGTTLLPMDNTIPQKTEGDEYMTLAITPTSATNKLKIDVVVVGSHNVNVGWVVALFQDSTSNALAAAWGGGYATIAAATVTFTHYMTAGTTSSTTFKVRAGGYSSGTFGLNNWPDYGAMLGGVAASSITITEVAV